MASLRKEDRPRKPWRADYVHNGRPRISRFATKGEAQRFLGDLTRGGAPGERQTLADWSVKWIRTFGVAWEARTLRDRGDYLERLILPDLGAVRLGAFKRATVREWRASLIERGVTPHVANRAVSILSAALGAAVEDELIEANPCARLKRLPEGGKRRQAATLDEVEGMRARLALLDYDPPRKAGSKPRGALPARPNPNAARDRAAVSLMAYAGVRPSELPTLAWVDVREATLVIRTARGADGLTKRTKTGGERVVPIIPALREDLDALERRGPLVLAGVDGAPLVVQNWTSRVWSSARKVVGTAITPYSCRHAFASLLIAEGRTSQEVAGLLGHSTPALTHTTYGHLFQEAQLRPDESMAEAVARARRAASISLTA